VVESLGASYTSPKFKIGGEFMRQFAQSVAFATLSLLFSGCSIIPGIHVNEGSTVEGRGGYRVVELTAEVVAASATAADSDMATGSESQQIGAAAEQLTALSALDNRDYRIGPGDVITVIVWDHPELTNPTGEFRDPASAGSLVSADGMVFYPYVGIFPAAGKTVAEVRQYLTERLARVIQSPQVDVRIAAFRAQRIQVTGEVKQPGLVTLDDRAKGILEAIGERGGLTSEASRRSVVLQRGGRTYRIDLAALLSGVRPVINPAIQSGDIIHVPDAASDRVFVMGEVRNNTPVTMLQNGLTLTEALTTAGGLDGRSARDSGVLVFRRGQETSDSVPTIFVLDMGRPEGMLLANEFQLAPRDIVYVKATSFAKYNSVINQLLPTISAVFQIDRLTKD
jgi:polysaccharide export outer membrane protein